MASKARSITTFIVKRALPAPFPRGTIATKDWREKWPSPCRTKIVRCFGVLHYNGANNRSFIGVITFKTMTYAMLYFGTNHAIGIFNGPLVAAAFFDRMKTGGNP
jgi:hypothetical protein